MEIKALDQRNDLGNSKRLQSLNQQFEQLIIELQNRDLPEPIVQQVNSDINAINEIPEGGNNLRSQLRKKLYGIFRLLEKELKLVPKNYYRNTWLALGMAAFGIPFGVAFGALLGNMAFLAIGMPIGMGIGMAIGEKMDQKAQKEGRQLNLVYSA